MSDTVEDDDNMIVIVVGDEANSKGDTELQIPFPFTIEIEPLDGSLKAESELFASQTEDCIEESKEDSIEKGNEEDSIKNENEEDSIKNENEEDSIKNENEGDSEEKGTNKDDYEEEYLDEDNIKDEGADEPEVYEVEYLEDLPADFEVEENGDNDDDDSSDEDQKKPTKNSSRIRAQKKKKRKRSPKRSVKSRKVVSFVKQLCKEKPKLAEDEQLLVDELANVMRETKPPPPPENFCQQIEDSEGVVYECSYCEAQRPTLPFAARHYQFKHGEFYLSCLACGVQYRNTTNLYKHEKRCSASDASIVLRARGHYLGRKGRGRPFTTTNRFITGNSPALKREKGRMFCSRCPASFVHRENLVAHEHSHAGLRPYRCGHCSMAYTSHTALKRHLRMHGESQFVCDHCGLLFKLRPALISHLDTHRTIRKYPCLCCERRFAQKSALRHHMNKVHLNLPPAHGCPVCPKRYGRLTHVKDHMHVAHGLTMITRRMYFQALPAMTEAEVEQARKLFNFEFSHTADANIIKASPDSRDGQNSTEMQKLVNIIKKKSTPIKYSEEYEESDDEKPDIHHEADNVGIEIEVPPNEEVKINAFKSRRKRVQIDGERVESDVYKIESKQNKKTAREQVIDDEMYKIVRDIKSTLPRKKVTQGKRNKKNFYEIKREFINELKKEMDMPEDTEDTNGSDDQRWELVVQDPETPDVIIPGTEIPERAISQNERGEDTSDEEEWKTYKDVSEKNMVIADFLNYMKSGVVPKHVPILRRGRKREVLKKLTESEIITGI